MTSTAAPTTPKTFVVGHTYTTGEARDYVWRFRIVSRTAKFITIVEVSHGTEGETKRVGVKKGYEGYEYALPLGSYSMAPTISADAMLPFLDEEPAEEPAACTPATHALAVVRCAGCGAPARSVEECAAEALLVRAAHEDAVRKANRLEVERLAELVGAQA